MKKFLALLTIISLFACAGCGSENTSLPAEGETAPPISEQTVSIPEPTGFAATKTGKFYNKFSGKKMTMKYEMLYDGQTVSVLSVTNGDKMYSETLVDGYGSSSIIDSEYIYTIDHSTKSVIKMSLQAANQPSIDTMIEESDVSLSDLVKSSRTIDQKTYDTEEWVIEGVKTVMCFDEDALSYIISEAEGTEYLIKILEISDEIDETLFDIPQDYTMTEI
ncbi:MAG: hypothetical protein Q4C12_01135 [Clostridia bacterium]|nr:hypothetical protein [Clostridia bacterium]